VKFRRKVAGRVAIAVFRRVREILERDAVSTAVAVGRVVEGLVNVSSEMEEVAERLNAFRGR
jgi:hypothetical protein